MSDTSEELPFDSDKLKELEKEKKKRRRVGRLMVFWRRFYRHKMGVFGLSIIIFVTLMGVLAPYIAGEGKMVPFEPKRSNLEARFLPPLSYEYTQDQNASWKLGGKEKTIAAIFVDETFTFTNGISEIITFPSSGLAGVEKEILASQLSKIDSVESVETEQELWTTGGTWNPVTKKITLEDTSFSGEAIVDYRVAGKISVNVQAHYNNIAAIKFKMKVQAESQTSSWDSELKVSIYNLDGHINGEDPLGSKIVQGFEVLVGGYEIAPSLIDFIFPHPGIPVEKYQNYTVVLETDVLNAESRGIDQRLFIEATGKAFDPTLDLCDNWNGISEWNTDIPQEIIGYLPVPPYDPILASDGEGWIPYVLIFRYSKKFHVLGTDALGVDILSATIWGATASLSVAFLAQSVSIIIGLSLGTVAGYFGGWIDNVLMRITDIILAVPTIFLLLIAVTIYEQITLPFMAVTIGLLGWAGTARIVRGQFLSLREIDYTDAARALGVPHRTIIFKHLLPNALAPVIVSVTLGTATVILIEAGLSFLGFGDPLAVSWGTAIQWGMVGNTLRFAPWVATIPGVAIFIVVLGFNLMGDALRDALDPRLR